MNKTKIFVSYCRKDKDWLERLRVHCRPLERAGLLDYWDDTKMPPGEQWRDEIRRQLSAATVAVLLISADFMASEFIASEELPQILLGEQNRGLRVLALMVKPCVFSDTKLSEFQLLNSEDAAMVHLSEADQETTWVRLVREIEHYSKQTWQDGDTGIYPEFRPASGIFSTPFERNPFFSGREPDLENLRTALETDHHAAICGLGGVGKTQLAVEYTYRHRHEYKNIFWVTSDSETEIVNAYSSIARLLYLPEANAVDQLESVDATRHWLETNSSWLLVFDKADEVGILKKFKPLNRAGDVLITSRNPTVQSLGIAKPFELEDMTREDAIDFLFRRTGRQSGNEREDRAAVQLVKDLGCLPLAMEQAAAYITANQSRFQDYRKGYSKRRLAVLPEPIAGGYPESVATTWALNFKEVAQTETAAELLRFSAFLGPNDIPLELLARGASNLGPVISSALQSVLEDPLLLDEALEPLYRYSLVKRNVERRTYSIHPIVQAVLMDEMDEGLRREWSERAVQVVQHVLPNPNFPSNWEACDRLLPHALRCIELVEKWSFDSKSAGFLILDTANYLRKRARFAEATTLYEQLLRLREQALGPDHTAVAHTLGSFASLHRSQGQYGEAESLLRRSLHIFEKTSGMKDSGVAWILNRLSALKRNMGHLEEAEQLARQALTIWENHPNPSNRNIAKGLTSLASVLRSQGRYAESEDVVRRSLEIEEKISGTHSLVSRNLTVLGDLLRMQGRLEDAEASYKRALSLDETYLGKDHPSVAWSLEGLAKIYEETHRIIEAERLHFRCLQLRKKAFRSGHPLVGHTRRQYSEFLASLGRLDEAAKIDPSLQIQEAAEETVSPNQGSQ